MAFLVSSRTRSFRDWVLFTLAALVPALAVGWLGLQALRGEEDATRREIDRALQVVAERTARRVHARVQEATVQLGDRRLAGTPEAVAAALREVSPPFAQPLVVSPDGVVHPPPGASAEAPMPRPEAAASAPEDCLRLATSLAANPEGDPAVRTRFLERCEEARSHTGRWLWPIIALRHPSSTDPQRLVDWVRSHASAMRDTERAATRDDVRGASWLGPEVRQRLSEALSSTASLHEEVTRTLGRDPAAAALRSGADSTGWVRWRGRGSWGVLRQLPDGTLAGFLIHAPSLKTAVRDGWPSLGNAYRADVSVGEPRAGTVLVHEAVIAPSLHLIIGLADPSILERQAQRGRIVLGTVGAGAMIIAFAIAAVLFTRMRRAKHLSELRTGFVSTVSHELRTPIASVRMLSELLEQNRVEPEERDEIHAALALEAKRLGDTVDRLLGFSRMAAGRYVIQREHASIVEVIHESIDTFERRHPDLPPVQRRMPHELDGDIDAGQLRLAVDNLLGNAHKYAPEGTPYRVEVREEDDMVVVDVADRGPGISRRDRKRVFQAFERGDDRLSSAVQGSGIGLSLVQHVARAHGGRAEALTNPGGGACMRLRIARRVR